MVFALGSGTALGSNSRDVETPRDTTSVNDDIDEQMRCDYASEIVDSRPSGDAVYGHHS